MQVVSNSDDDIEAKQWAIAKGDPIKKIATVAVSVQSFGQRNIWCDDPGDDDDVVSSDLTKKDNLTTITVIVTVAQAKYIWDIFCNHYWQNTAKAFDCVPWYTL